MKFCQNSKNAGTAGAGQHKTKGEGRERIKEKCGKLQEQKGRTRLKGRVEDQRAMRETTGAIRWHKTKGKG